MYPLLPFFKKIEFYFVVPFFSIASEVMYPFPILSLVILKSFQVCRAKS